MIALISFLRAQPAVQRPLPDAAPSFVGKALFAFAIGPVGPRAPPPAAAPSGPTVERGRYLAHAVSACAGCHTERDMLDGSYVGLPFAGGTRMDDETDPAHLLVTPNLTPDPRTGRMASWTEDGFVARMRKGGAHPGSHMPWPAYARMAEDDLRALYRYLRTVPPVENETGPSVQPRS